MVTLALAGCTVYDGEASGELGDTLSFPHSRNSATDMTLAVLDLTQVRTSDAEGWGVDADDGDVYFMHYSANGGTASVSSADWAVVTESGEVILAEDVGFSSLDDAANCEWWPDNGPPCAVFVVPQSESVTAVRYYGVYTGNRSAKGGYSDNEWVVWRVE